MRKVAVATAASGLMLTAAVLSTPLVEPASAATAKRCCGVYKNRGGCCGKYKNRGNLWKSGNNRTRGRMFNSNSWDNANAAVNSDNSINGSNYSLGDQRIWEGVGIVKLKRRH